MNKAEAVLVLKEILAICKDTVAVDWISLDSASSQMSKTPDSDDEYLIKMKAELDDYSKEELEALLGKHGLVMRGDKGFVVISKANS